LVREQLKEAAKYSLSLIGLVALKAVTFKFEVLMHREVAWN